MLPSKPLKSPEREEGAGGLDRNNLFAGGEGKDLSDRTAGKIHRGDANGLRADFGYLACLERLVCGNF